MDNIVAYTNALSLVVFAQAVRIEQLQYQLDANTAVLLKARNCIDELTTALVGHHETFTIEENVSW